MAKNKNLAKDSFMRVENAESGKAKIERWELLKECIFMA